MRTPPAMASSIGSVMPRLGSVMRRRRRRARATTAASISSPSSFVAPAPWASTWASTRRAADSSCVAGREHLVHGGDLARVDHRLAEEPELARGPGAAPQPVLIVERGVDAVDRGADPGRPRGEHQHPAGQRGGRSVGGAGEPMSARKSVAPKTSRATRGAAASSAAASAAAAVSMLRYRRTVPGAMPASRSSASRAAATARTSSAEPILGRRRPVSPGRSPRRHRRGRGREGRD